MRIPAQLGDLISAGIHAILERRKDHPYAIRERQVHLYRRGR